LDEFRAQSSAHGQKSHDSTGHETPTFTPAAAFTLLDIDDSVWLSPPMRPSAQGQISRINKIPSIFSHPSIQPDVHSAAKIAAFAES
jgi:hypothetical protein